MISRFILERGCGSGEQVLETTSSAAGAVAVGVLLTAVLPTTLEDLMALALCGLLSYVSFLNWPLKRADIKKEVAEKYRDLSARLDGELTEELSHATGKLKSKVQRLVVPLLEEAQSVQALVEKRQARLEVRDASRVFQSFPSVLQQTLICKMATIASNPYKGTASINGLPE
jgi:hypothetical protein